MPIVYKEKFSTPAESISNIETYFHPEGDGNLHVPATETTNNGKVLTAGSTAGDISWQDIPLVELTGMAQLPTMTLIGNNSGITSTPKALTIEELSAMGIAGGGGIVGGVSLISYDCSDQIVVGGETHFSIFPSGEIAFVFHNGMLQPQSSVILDEDGLGIAIDFDVVPGDLLIVLRGTSSTGGSSGHVIQDAGTNMTARTYLNIIGATVEDDASNDATKITIPDTPAHTIQDGGTNKTQRANLNFIGATVTDNSTNDSTDIEYIPEIVTHDHTGSDGTPKLLQANTHETPDTDSGTSSLHHTLGTGANQAAAGNHTHSPTDVSHIHNGNDGSSKLFQANTHESPDTDTSTSSLHHTLGTGSNQAAAGNHTHTVTKIMHAQAVLTIEGVISATGTKPVRIYMPYVGAGATIEEIFLSVNTAPTSTTLRVDVNKNGTSIFNSVQYAEIVAGSNTVSKTTDFATTALAKDDYLTIEVVLGNTVASDLSVHVRYKWEITGV